jgi:hypothetical protein
MHGAAPQHGAAGIPAGCYTRVNPIRENPKFQRHEREPAMTMLLNLIHSLLPSSDADREQAESYLAQSRDIYELERRMYHLTHSGQAAW